MMKCWEKNASWHDEEVTKSVNERIAEILSCEDVTFELGFYRVREGFKNYQYRVRSKKGVFTFMTPREYYQDVETENKARVYNIGHDSSDMKCLGDAYVVFVDKKNFKMLHEKVIHIRHLKEEKAEKEREHERQIKALEKRKKTIESIK